MSPSVPIFFICDSGHVSFGFPRSVHGVLIRGGSSLPNLDFRTARVMERIGPTFVVIPVRASVFLSR